MRRLSSQSGSLPASDWMPFSRGPAVQYVENFLAVLLPNLTQHRIEHTAQLDCRVVVWRDEEQLDDHTSHKKQIGKGNTHLLATGRCLYVGENLGNTLKHLHQSREKPSN